MLLPYVGILIAEIYYGLLLHSFRNNPNTPDFLDFIQRGGKRSDESEGYTGLCHSRLEMNEITSGVTQSSDHT
jgi:hypothetical protein